MKVSPSMKNHLQKLRETALAAGASDARYIHPRQIVIEDALADYCVSPQCSNYGLSAGCPPHVEGPETFRRWCSDTRQVLVVRKDVSVKLLFSEKKDDELRALHRIVADVEMHALQLMYPKSLGFAGGSCKKLFCGDHDNCLRLSEKALCRNPLCARPSMSGFGVHVVKLMEAAGWQVIPACEEDSSGDAMSWIAGLVLLRR